jgi:hypothetical protein
LSQYEIADILTRVLERKITYVPLDIEAFQKLLKERGYTPHFQQHVGGIAEEIRVRPANRSVAARAGAASPREGVKTANRSRCPARTFLAVVP